MILRMVYWLLLAEITLWFPIFGLYFSKAGNGRRQSFLKAVLCSDWYSYKTFLSSDNSPNGITQDFIHSAPWMQFYPNRKCSVVYIQHTQLSQFSFSSHGFPSLGGSYNCQVQILNFQIFLRNTQREKSIQLRRGWCVWRCVCVLSSEKNAVFLFQLNCKMLNYFGSTLLNIGSIYRVNDIKKN